MMGDDSCLVVFPDECADRPAYFVKRLETRSIEHLLAQRPDESLRDAVRLGLRHEGRRRFDPEKPDLVLEILHRVLSAPVVPLSGTIPWWYRES